MATCKHHPSTGRFFIEYEQLFRNGCCKANRNSMIGEGERFTNPDNNQTLFCHNGELFKLVKIEETHDGNGIYIPAEEAKIPHVPVSFDPSMTKPFFPPEIPEPDEVTPDDFTEILNPTVLFPSIPPKQCSCSESLMPLRNIGGQLEAIYSTIMPQSIKQVHFSLDRNDRSHKIMATVLMAQLQGCLPLLLYFRSTKIEKAVMFQKAP